jgi:hypothetical protein
MDEPPSYMQTKTTNYKSSETVFNISTVIALLKVRKSQECSGAVLLSPEQQLQRDSERQIGRPQLGKTNTVVSDFALWYERQQQKLHPLRHVGVETRWVSGVVHVLAAPLEARHRQLMGRQRHRTRGEGSSDTD